MIHIPTEKEQIEFCSHILYSRVLQKSSKKCTPEAMNVTDEVFIIAVNNVLKEPLSETELSYFKKHILDVNKILLTKN